MKKISVIIPVYNVEVFLSDCIESVLAQIYENIEIILVDDGSKDNSGKICDKYASEYPSIKALHKENGGASSARNMGLDNAKGDYVFFLDSDDHIEKDALSKLVSAIEKEDGDIAFCQAYAEDDATGKVSLSNYGYHRDYGTGKGSDFFEEMVRNKEFHVAVWQLLYKRKFLEANDLRFVEGIMYEDCIFALKIYCLADKAVHVNEYLYHRRYRANSVMTSKKTERNFVSALKAYKEVLAFCDEMNGKVDTNEYLSRIAFNAMSNYRALDSNDKKKYRNDFTRLKKNILLHNAFEDGSLKASCKGKLFWIIYKVFNKLFSVIRR